MSERKYLAFNNLKAEASGRVRAGICAVFGNVDSWGDRIHAGAFVKTIQEGKSRIKFLWNHGTYGFTTARILELKEVGRGELPPEVLEKAPDATGGLKVVREYYDDDEGNKILTRIDADDINEMSFAFDVVRSSDTTEETDLEDMPKRHIRELLELKMYDASDVLWGMNGATVAAGAKSRNLLPLGALYEQTLMHLNDFKAGRRNSESDLVLLNQIHKNIVDLGAECAPVEDEKSSNEPEKKEAEAAKSTSLNSEWLELRKRNLQILEI